MIDVRRAGDRARTTGPGIDSRHSFAYGPHYDPDNLGFGLLLVNNEDRLAPGAGFDRHRHRDVDIVTWMISGTLEHEDSAGNRQRLSTGMAQHLATGSGVEHAEHSPANSGGAHYVQMWVGSSDSAGPRYAAGDFADALVAGNRPSALIPVASGLRDSAAPLRLDQPAAEFAVARLPIDESIELPTAPLVHVFVAWGVLVLTGPPSASTVRPGDTVRLSDAAGVRLAAAEAGEILVWVLHR